MVEALAVNTSPLIFLAKANRLSLLRAEGLPVHVPRPVVDEIGRFGAGDRVAQALADSPWLQVVDSPPLPPSVLAWDLGAGESSVIAWALGCPGVGVVMDDLEGRLCARAHRLVVRGTLGVVVAAKRRGEIASARALMQELRAAGMYLADAVLDRALAEVGE